MLNDLIPFGMDITSSLAGIGYFSRHMGFVLFFLGFLSPGTLATWTGDSYWNDRYGTKPGWVSYTADDSENGMFSDNLQDKYQLPPSQYSKKCVGCLCSTIDPIVKSCSSGTINLAAQNFINITAETFTSSSISSISILGCADFNLIGNDTFDHLGSLSKLTIQETGIEVFPDIEQTSMEFLNLVKNKIVLTTATYVDQVLPSSLTHVALTYNSIYWLPPGLFSYSNIKILSLGYNKFTQFPYDAVANMPELLYLGLEGNGLEIITHDNMKALANSKLQHLNISNNELTFIERYAFSQLVDLKILELHQNKFTTIPFETLYNIPELLHIDLNNNELETLGSKVLQDLPKLVTLRLHTQKTPMRAISYDAFKNIGQALENLWVSDNALVTFPHQVLAEGSYPALLQVYADNNQISDVVEFGSEAYDILMQPYYTLKKLEYVAFSTSPNIEQLILDNNRIGQLRDTDFCEASNLRYLYLSHNVLTEDTININTFDCIPRLYFLSLASNNIQYVPQLFMNDSHLPSIYEMKLNDNHITFLLEGHFANLTTLSILQLEYNNIISIENGSFPAGITQLNLEGNNFRFLHEGPLTGLASLTSLRLANNDITILPDNAFHGCTSLSSLTLNNNKIGRLLQVHFRDCPLTGALEFQDNNIAYIENGTFAHVTSCTDFFLQNNELTSLQGDGDFHDLSVGSLNLADNRITSLTTGLFKNLAVAKTLDFSGNKISRVEPLAFNGVTSGVLTLANNPLRSIQSGAFTSCNIGIMDFQNLNIADLQSHAFTNHSSGTINLQGNPLVAIQPEIFCRVSVSKIDLQSSDLTTLGEPMFCASSTVQELSLNNNGLLVVPSNVFNGVVLTKLNLEDNQLTVFPGPALASQNLEKILLARNQIFEFPVGSFVVSQTAMIELDLSNNDLTVLPSGLLAPLINLEILRLGHNQITWMDADVLNPLTNLQEIYLQNNGLPYFPALPSMTSLKNLDLSNNAIKTLAYGALLNTDTSTLKSVDLSGNPLECDCYLFEVANSTQESLTGGTCANPSRTAGYLFAYSQKDAANYFLSQTVEDFQCSAANVAASDPGPYQLQVNFNTPLSLFPDDGIGSGGGSISSGTFHLTCEASSVASLTHSFPVSPSVTLFSKTFLQSDGVVPGTRYGCYVTLETDGYTSGHSPTAYLVTQTIAGGSSSTGDCGVTVMCLPTMIYDFSLDNSDFNGRSTAVYSQPTYVPSPYGAWLAISSTPSVDTFSQFFREVSTVNQVFSQNLTLAEVGGAPVTTYRLWEADFYPVDGLGYLHQSQKDCNSQLHNFGFTSAARASMQYQGTGTIAVGGGDEIWLYVNGVLLLEVITNPASGTVPCKRIDISAARDTGGAILTPYSGSVSGGICTATTALTAEQVHLELEVGDTYHFDLFQIERFGCKSKYFLEVTEIRFSQFSNDDPAMDYFVTVAEDTAIDGIISVLNLKDTFSMGPSFEMTVIKGNEARHFELKQDTTANRNAAIPPPAPVYSYTTLPAVKVSFIECSSPQVIVPEPVVSGSESFTPTSGFALLTLKTELDYEVATRYVVVMTVIDAGTSPDRTGQIVVRVTVSDVNDNCPVLVQDTFTLQPVPALQVDPIIYLSATDPDAGANAEIVYYAALPTVNPSLTRYDASYDLYDMVYNDTSRIEVTLVAMDKGSPPRGVTATAHITLSNSCLLSVLFEAIDVNILVDANLGNVFLRIPKYWVYNYECLRTAGMQKGYIQDYQVTASSNEPLSVPGRARLNETYDPVSFLTGGWVASIQDNQQWLKVDMLVPYKFQQVLTQGRQDVAMWVKKYRIQYSDDDVTWTLYTDANGDFRFNANTDQDGVVTLDLDPPILARYIRINPRQWQTGVAMRIELVGCEQSEQFYYDTACERCQTSWYCIGDGLRQPCGRCDPPIEGSTCGRSPSEHSFGASDTCNTCPAGWICHDGYASPCPQYHFAECNETYCPTACTQCEVGYACRGGQRYQCLPGQASDGNLEFCDNCLPGTYQNESGQSVCLNCPAGHVSSTMKSHCSPCPIDTWSLADGKSCQECLAGQCRCLMDPYPCHNKNVPCYNLADDGTSYICGNCPPGFQGDGTTCMDIDECSNLPSLCWNSNCINTQPGYQCMACPWGYTGTFEDGLARDVVNRVYEDKNELYATSPVQSCSDINECNINNGGCDLNSACINTVGSYSCGFCNKGYMGDQKSGCYADNLCTTGKHNCHSAAVCVYTGPGSFRCECADGFAGDGIMCGLDPDLDGHVSVSLQCITWGCAKDNCPDISNSGQEDNDGDSIGDFCDPDDDNDAVFDGKDNCQYVVNYNQSDGDSDGVGDACDNCPAVVNSNQVDTDEDGQGDACDTDDDNDGVLDGIDVCTTISDPGQADTDADGIGDACDNCKQVSNALQTDTDQNGVGDDCDTPGALNIDWDGDGILDIVDNCGRTPNADQSDIDQDGTGDACDSDIDGDTITNNLDNCPYVANSAQQETNGNGIGDACEQDTDGDGVQDKVDPCPKNPSIKSVDFTDYTYVDLDPTLNSNDLQWEIMHQGAEVRQLTDTVRPGLLIGPHGFSDVDYSGTWYVLSDSGDGYVGFVFGYQSNRKFYLVQWKKSNFNYGGSTYRGGIKGVQLKLVNSPGTGPGSALANALWHSADTSNMATVLWHEPDMIGWEYRTAFRWHLTWRPATGLIRIRVVKGTSTIVDSGDLYDTTITGGRLGVFVFDQAVVHWSNLVYWCQDRANMALTFDGSDDYVELPYVQALGLEESFTIEAWVRLPDSYSTGRLPVVCTSLAKLCMAVENGALVGQVSNVKVTGTTSLPVSYWNHLTIRYELETYNLTLFVNGTALGADNSQINVLPANWNTSSPAAEDKLYLGRDATTWLHGDLDEVRIYNRWLPDAEITPNLAEAGLFWQKHKYYLVAHYNMDDDSSTPTLLDNSVFQNSGVIYGNAEFAQSTGDSGRFEVGFPNNR